MNARGPGVPLVLTGLAAPLGATLWWMMVDDIPLRQAFASPVPYGLAALTWFVALPVYAVLHDRIRDRLWPLLLLATLGATPPAGLAFAHFLSPRDLFAAFLILTTTWVGTLTFWATLCVYSGLPRRGVTTEQL